ncbi:hypothetical protein J8340_23460, partial [Escherichia coli]|uniref:hypothetical protein n=1 Tax=Escherichia coli TaxID=562 RepID=UPI001AECA902
MGVSHLREAFKLIYLFSNEMPIIEFIKSLGNSIEDRFNKILNVNNQFNDPNSIFHSVLIRTRNEAFHYYESTPKYKQKLSKNLETLSDKQFHIDIAGTRRSDIDYVFASETTFHILFGNDVTEEQLSQIMREVATLNTLFLNFSDDLV